MQEATFYAKDPFFSQEPNRWQDFKPGIFFSLVKANLRLSIDFLCKDFRRLQRGAFIWQYKAIEVIYREFVYWTKESQSFADHTRVSIEMSQKCLYFRSQFRIAIGGFCAFEKLLILHTFQLICLMYYKCCQFYVKCLKSTFSDNVSTLQHHFISKNSFWIACKVDSQHRKWHLLGMNNANQNDN